MWPFQAVLRGTGEDGLAWLMLDNVRWLYGKANASHILQYIQITQTCPAARRPLP